MNMLFNIGCEGINKFHKVYECRLKQRLKTLWNKINRNIKEMRNLNKFFMRFLISFYDEIFFFGEIPRAAWKYIIISPSLEALRNKNINGKKEALACKCYFMLRRNRNCIMLQPQKKDSNCMISIYFFHVSDIPHSLCVCTCPDSFEFVRSSRALFINNTEKDNQKIIFFHNSRHTLWSCRGCFFNRPWGSLTRKTTRWRCWLKQNVDHYWMNMF